MKDLEAALIWMQSLQGPKDPRVPDQGKVKLVINAARTYHSLLPLLTRLVEARKAANKYPKIIDYYGDLLLDDDDEFFYSTAANTIEEISKILERKE
jgi:hypothetical protein